MTHKLVKLVPEGTRRAVQEPRSARTRTHVREAVRSDAVLPPNDGPAVRVRDLRKSYGSVEAVRGIDLDVARGEIFALLGPNGAGKTSTVEILEGYRTRSSGEVSVLGHDPARGEPALKARIGIVLQTSAAERYLTAREIVAMYAGYYPTPRRPDELLELVGLAAQAKTPIKKLSGGQRRRLDLAIALAGDPELLFLDEPTTGFDPSARRGAWSMVRELSRLGKTVLLTTHFMDEAEALADRIAVLVDGRIVAAGTPAEVIARHSAETIIRVRLPDGAPPPAVLGLAPSAGGDGEGILENRTTDPTRALHELTGWALRESVAIETIEVARPSLEDVYLALTGRRQDEGMATEGDT
jgi:ABC-2 type transport system ATP-binding protein